MREQLIRLGYGCWVFYAVWKEKSKWRVNFQKNIHDDNDINKYDKEIESIENKRFKTEEKLFREIDAFERKVMKTDFDKIVSGDALYNWSKINGLLTGILCCLVGIFYMKISVLEKEINILRPKVESIKSTVIELEVDVEKLGG